MKKRERVVLIVCISLIIALSSIVIFAIFTSGPAKKIYEGPLVDCKCRFVRSGRYRSLRCHCPKLLEAEKSIGRPYKYGEK